MVVGAMVAMLVVVVALLGAVVAKAPSDFLSQAMVVASGGMAGVLVRHASHVVPALVHCTPSLFAFVVLVL